MIVYHDENDNEVQFDVRELITSVTASASRKRSDGDYGSDDAFQSYTATLPPHLPAEAIEQVASELYAMCESAVSERLASARVQPEDRRDGQKELLQQIDKGGDSFSYSEMDHAPSELDNYFEPRNQQEAQSEQGNDAFPLVTFPPKRSESKPGQTYSVIVTEYACDKDKEVRFYGSGKHPFYYHDLSPDSKSLELFAVFFPGWQPKPTEKGKHVKFKGQGLKLFIECSEKLTSSGNPYHNLNKAESIK